jgi:predicted ester cyclase
MKSRVLVFLWASLFLVGVAAQGSSEKSKLDLKTVADKIMKTFNTADPVAIANLYGQDAVMIQPNEPVPVRGRPAILQSYQSIFKAFPNWKFDFVSILYSGDTIIFELVGHGSMTGPLVTPEGELAPTGKSLDLKTAFFAKISPAGLIVEDRSYFDNAEMMKALGMLK